MSSKATQDGQRAANQGHLPPAGNDRASQEARRAYHEQMKKNAGK